MLYFISDLRHAEERADVSIELHYFPSEANLDGIRALRVMGTSSDWDPKMCLQGRRELLEVEKVWNHKKAIYVWLLS